MKKQLISTLVRESKHSKPLIVKAVTDLLDYLKDNKDDLYVENLGEFIHKPYRSGYVSYLNSGGILLTSLRKRRVGILKMDQKIFLHLLAKGHDEKMAIDVFMLFCRLTIQGLIDNQEVRLTNVCKIIRTKAECLSVEFCSWN
jgi:hypothetical protein